MDDTQHAKRIVDAATHKPDLPILPPDQPLRFPLRVGDNVITGEELQPEDIWPSDPDVPTE